MPPVINPAVVIQQGREFPTPILTDLLFYESVDVTTPSHNLMPGGTRPEIGSAHPDTTNWPNHKLCFVEQIDDQGHRYHYWYVADRALQESYNNIRTEFPYGGNIRFPRATRHYVLPRRTSPVEKGTADPGPPTYPLWSGSDTYLRPDGSAIFRPDGTSSYIRPTASGAPAGVLIAEVIQNIEGKIGTLYQLYTRIFDVIPGYDGDVAGLSQADNGYIVTRPTGTDSFLRLVWKLYLPRELADGGRRTNYTECPITGYESLLLVNEQTAASDENNQVSVITRVYEGNVDASAFPSTEAIVGTVKEFPGAMPPDKFTSILTTVSTSNEIIDPVGVTISEVPGVTNTYALTRIEIKPADVVRGTKTVTTVTFTLATLAGQKFDDYLQAYVPYTVSVMQKDAADLLTDQPGYEFTVAPYSDYWSIVTTETPLPCIVSVTAGGVTVVHNVSPAPGVYTTRPFHWPAVFGVLAWGTTADGEAYFNYKPKRAEWSGLCKAYVETAYYVTNPISAVTSIPIRQMQPLEIRLNWPGVARFTIPESLHEEMSFFGTGPDGTIFPVTTFEATNYTDWPAAIVAGFEVTRYKGGFRVVQTTITKPSDDAT